MSILAPAAGSSTQGVVTVAPVQVASGLSLVGAVAWPTWPLPVFQASRQFCALAKFLLMISSAFTAVSAASAVYHQNAGRKFLLWVDLRPAPGSPVMRPAVTSSHTCLCTSLQTPARFSASTSQRAGPLTSQHVLAGHASEDVRKGSPIPTSFVPRHRESDLACLPAAHSELLCLSSAEMGPPIPHFLLDAGIASWMLMGLPSHPKCTCLEVRRFRCQGCLWPEIMPMLWLLLRLQCWCPLGIPVLKSSPPNLMVLGGRVFGR